VKLPLIPIDKANHFIYGFAIYIIANTVLPDLHSLVVVLVFGLAKEIKDQIDYQGFDYKDLIATILPAIVLAILN
jgi:hypothetical protein